MMGKDFDDLAAIKASKSEEKHGEEDIVIKAVGLGKKGYIKPFDLVIHKGEVVGFTGLLGSGRSETVRVLYGAEKPDEGELSVKGRPIAARHPPAWHICRRIGKTRVSSRICPCVRT